MKRKELGELFGMALRLMTVRFTDNRLRQAWQERRLSVGQAFTACVLDLKGLSIGSHAERWAARVNSAASEKNRPVEWTIADRN